MSSKTLKFDFEVGGYTGVAEVTLVTTKYGEDADGNRGIIQTFIEEVVLEDVYKNNSPVEPTKEEYEQICEAIERDFINAELERESD
jgi:hypothetical protein